MAINRQDLIDLLIGVRPELSDNMALKYATIYPAWAVGIEITQDMIDKGQNRYQFSDRLYKCRQPHTTQADWTPDITPALWTLIDVTHAGTIDDPIPVPSEVSSFEYEWGKYYSEDGILYLCNRQGGKEGDTYVLDFKPSALVGHYFKVVE